MESSRQFPYDLAFDRNIGWLTEWEQLALREKRVAIAGMGGVGGVHLITLARLGIGAFTIADLDVFEFVNFNRQVGAVERTVGRPKAEVLQEMALGINPEICIRRFDAGVTDANIDDFLADADLFVDGFDFFAIDIRRKVFARAAELNIPAITAAPIGMGTAYLVFMPGQMTFEEYFRLNVKSEVEKYARFLVGLTPKGLHLPYLVDGTRVNLGERRGPSTIAACQLCSGVTAVAVLKILLRRAGVMPAPYHHHFDAYRNRLAVTRLRFGNRGPWQRLKVFVIRRRFDNASGDHPPALPAAVAARTPIEEILNLARWAPSGDNSQPWRFRLIDADTVHVSLQQPSDNVYEYRKGEPTLLSTGALIESMAIAASAWQRRMTWEPGEIDGCKALTVRFRSESQIERDPLVSFLTLRSVDRRPYRWRPLSSEEKALLEAAAGPTLCLEWHESLPKRWQIARLTGLATDIRQRCPEAFVVHQRMIDWQRAQSPSGIPARAVGLSWPALTVMRWAMGSSKRIRWLNMLGGPAGTALELDLLPGLASAAYFVMRPAQMGSSTPASVIEAGRRIQRFWLTATKIGLAMQPILAVLAFAHYGERHVTFTAEPKLQLKAAKLAARFAIALGTSPSEVIFMGRVGEPNVRLPLYRSSRYKLAELIDE